MNLEPTGERMIEEHYKSSPEDFVIYLMHVATYDFAETFTRGKRVLDYGCGSGYGSARIADSARSVMAVDVADDAIEHASSHYLRDNLQFRVIEPTDPLPFEKDSFDVVLSFQVFEHVADTERYLAEVRRVLAPGGKFFLVTPDRGTRLLPFQRPWNRWHLHEYGKRELELLLGRHFDSVEMLSMSAKPEMAAIELHRCRKVKWLMLPFTLPFIPDRLRIAGLNWVHKIRRAKPAEPQDHPFSVDDVTIAPDATPSMNLVAVVS